MPSIIAHAIAGSAVSVALAPASVLAVQTERRRWLTIGMTAAVLPDIDVLFAAVPFIGAYIEHRGVSHSVAFSVVAGLAMWLLSSAWQAARACRGKLALTVTLSVLSHTLLDGLTNRRAGVQLWAPFSTEPVIFHWQPISVGYGPSGLGRLTAIVLVEIVWVVLPAACIIGLALWLKRSPTRVAPTN
jgi:membrane-bound metal-dependent hydrolase YbcI (DUF457 family)